jgi:hypothetical protein
VGCLGVVGTAQKIEFGEGGCAADIWNRGREGNGGGVRPSVLPHRGRERGGAVRHGARWREGRVQPTVARRHGRDGQGQAKQGCSPGGVVPILEEVGPAAGPLWASRPGPGPTTIDLFI